MANSMTGYAQGEQRLGDYCLSWRLHSVNHRFLDLAFRVPNGWQKLEIEAAKRIKNHLKRGHLTCEFQIFLESGSAKGVCLDLLVLEDLLRLESDILEGSNVEREALSVHNILSWPGVIQKNGTPNTIDETLFPQALSVLESVLEDLKQTRATEGRGLQEVLNRLMDDLLLLLKRLKERLPQASEEQHLKFQNRVAKLVGQPVDPGDLARELAFLLNRSDIEEEVERLHIHQKEMRTVLAGSEVMGRRLDFLCQELNREANTLCSKASDGEISRLGLEMKVLVEKMREQVQNLE